MRELEGDEISRFPMRPSWQAGRQGRSGRAINGSERMRGAMEMEKARRAS